MLLWENTANFLCPVVPAFVCISFFILLACFSVNFNALFKRIDKGVLIRICVLVCLSLAVRLAVPHYHTTFIDGETWHIFAAKTIINGNFCSSFLAYGKPAAWPFLLSAAFRIFPAGGATGINFSCLLGALTSVNIFLITYFIAKQEKIALFSALIFAFLPIHIRWSASAENNVASVYFLTLSAAAFFLFQRERNTRCFVFFLSCVVFAVQMRAENYILPLFYIAIFIAFGIKLSIRQAVFALAAVILVLPDFIHSYYWYLRTDWVASLSVNWANQDNVSFKNFVLNFREKGGYILEYYPAVFSITAAAGIYYLIRIKKYKEVIFLTGLFGVFFVALFSSWLQVHAAFERLFLIFYAVLPAFSAYGCLYLKSIVRNAKTYRFILAGFWLAVFLSYLHLFSFPVMAWTNYPKHAESSMFDKIGKDLPPDSLIIAPRAEIAGALTNFNYTSLEDLLDHPGMKERILKKFTYVFFVEDYFCFYCDSSYSCGLKEKCGRIKALFPFKLYKRYEEGGVYYNLYLLQR